MVSLHAQVIKRDGKKEYVVLPYEEFLEVREQLDDYEDLRCLRSAKDAEKDAPTVGIDELKDKLAARPTRATGRRRTP